MADAHLRVGVGVDVELSPGPVTEAWLISLGWTKPVLDEPEIEAEQDVFAAEDEDTDDLLDQFHEAQQVMRADQDGAKVPMEVGLSEDNPACAHQWSGTPCDWNVCYQPEDPCTSTLVDGANIRSCARVRGHKGIHSDGRDGWQWKAGDPKEVVPTARPIRALTGVEAQRHKAAKLRQSLMTELNRPGELDQLLRLCDFDPDILPDPDCDC